jgi:signal transduction histidine kinase
VPRLAEACMVWLLADGRQIQDIAVKHADMGRQRLLAGLVDGALADADRWGPVLSVAQSGHALVLSRLASACMLERIGAPHAVIGELSIKGAALVPVLDRRTEQPLGVVVLLSERAQHFGTKTLLLASELAERSALALELGQMYNECRTALAERQEMLATTVHDVLSPLTVIKGTTQRLHGFERSMADADAICELRTRLETINIAVNRITTALTTLLQSARTDPHVQHSGSFERTDLVALTRRIAAEQQLDAAEHTLRITEAPDHLIGNWDANQLERMLTNLLSNAVKYSPTGSVVELTLDALQDEDGTWAVVKITDVGVGIPAQDLPFVFEPFWRGRNVGDAEGVGLGLASVWHIVKTHAGRLLIDSQEGEGTCVTVRLPLGAANSQ